jgi:GNAT superfamily N-acetyltransferase
MPDADDATAAPGAPDGPAPLASWSADVGRRVTLRRRVGGGLADVVGVVESVTDQVRIRRRDRTLVDVAPGDVVSARVVTPPRQRLTTAAEVTDLVLERVAAHGWRPLERVDLGLWRLRAAHGFTGRANSVLPLGDPGRPLPQAVSDATDWYQARRLVPTFQVPLPLAVDLDRQLAGAGWELTDPVDVLVADLDPVRQACASIGSAPAEVRLADTPDDQWLATYRYRGGELPAEARSVLLNAAAPIFASAVAPAGATVAVGRAVVTGQWVGLTAVDVVPTARRRGLATAVADALLQAATDRGARHVYLQVAADNHAAQSLYRRLGFTRHHGYHYRRRPTAPPQ